jgi:hypothetical protein
MPLTSPYTGRRAAVGIGKESSRGSTGASAEYWIPHAALSYLEKVNKIRDDSGFGVIETPKGSDVIKRWTEGDIEFNIRDLSVGLIFLALLGTEAFEADTPASGVGRHTFTVATSNQHQSLTIFKKNPVETLASANAVIKSLSLRAVLDQYVRITAGFIGKVFQNDTETVAYVSENKFRPQDLVIKLASNTSGLAATSAISTIRSLTLNVEKNVEDYQGLSSVDPVDFVNKDFQVTGSFEIAFENNTYKGYSLLNTLEAMSIKLLNAGAISSGTTNPSLEIILDEVDFDNFDMDESNENVAVLTANFTAHYNDTNSQMIKAILENSKNTAY